MTSYDQGTSYGTSYDQSEQSGPVAGVFSNASDAQQAIFELRDQGFGADRIGAAFHSEGYSTSVGSDSANHPDASGVLQPANVAFTVSPGVTGAGSGATGARSDASAVTPAGLASGSGTASAGAGRPMPKPIAQLHRDGGDPYKPIQSSAVYSEGAFPSTGGFSDASEGHQESHQNRHGVWDKLKSFFSGDDAGDVSSPRTPPSGVASVATKSSLNFGTGEGHLGAVTVASLEAPESKVAYDDYSSEELERSFYGMGIPQESARRIAHQLSPGGAIVTVRAGARVAEAEQVLESNGARLLHRGWLDSSATGQPYDTSAGGYDSETSGVSRFRSSEYGPGEPASAVLANQSPGQNRAVLFGEVLRQRRQPVASETEIEQRKAS